MSVTLERLDECLYKCRECGMEVSEIRVSEELYRIMADRIGDMSSGMAVMLSELDRQHIRFQGIPVKIKKQTLEDLARRVSHLEEREGVRNE